MKWRREKCDERDSTTQYRDLVRIHTCQSKLTRTLKVQKKLVAVDLLHFCMLAKLSSSSPRTASASIATRSVQ